LRRTRPLGLAAVAATALAAVAAGPALAGNIKSPSRGPSSSANPYVVPVASGVRTISLITSGDTVGGYRYVGIPDGLGATRQKNTLTVYNNHELGAERGVPRKHGEKGAFVSQLTIDARTGRVLAGEDLIDQGVDYWNYITQTYSATYGADKITSPAGVNPRDAGVVTTPAVTGPPAVPAVIARDTFAAQTAAFNRFCSSSLSAAGQFLNRRTKTGYEGRIYFANEEGGDNSRSFGVTTDGKAQQLPRLGLFSWENTLAAYNRSSTTVIAGMEDAAGGQLWIYSGTKSRRGTAFDKAGLTNGVNFVIDADDESVKTDAEFRTTFGKGKPAAVDLSEVDWDQSGAAQNREAAADGLTLNRIEDGAWDPRKPNDLYFVTTEGGRGADVPTGRTGRDGGGVWRMHFEDIEEPEQGGTLTLLLDGSEAPLLNKPDNVDIDRRGNLLIQEDPGNNTSVARIVAYNVDSGRRGVVAEFDRELFAPRTAGGTDARITIDEESSGIIDAEDVLGRGWWLFDAQLHPATAPSSYNDGVTASEEIVERGQLLALKVDDIAKAYTIAP